eukprot:5460674-Karenia_brevis.AAC.1
MANSGKINCVHQVLKVKSFKRVLAASQIALKSTGDALLAVAKPNTELNFFKRVVSPLKLHQRVLVMHGQQCQKLKRSPVLEN